MKINLSIASTWNALSNSQTENICHALYCQSIAAKNNSDQKAITRINELTFFYISKQLLRYNNFFKIQRAIQEFRISAYNDISKFIFQGVELHNFKRRIRTPGFKYLYGPFFRLKNITIAEFAFVDVLYYQWRQTDNIAFLDLLCATLYRPKSDAPSTLDCRVPFNKILSEKNAETFSKISLKKKLAISYAFEGSRNYMVSIYPHVFPPKRKTKTENKKPRPAPKYTPIGELISAKIDYDPSKLSQVKKLMANEFFAIYENELKQIKSRPKK